jgi:putative ABC transport system substrate-binding protein
LREFRQLGWVDGETAHIDIRWGAGDAARIRKGITELLALAPDVIVTTSTPPTSMFREATRTIPIIFGSMSIPSGQESSRLYRTPVAMLRDLQTTNTASVRNGSSC